MLPFIERVFIDQVIPIQRVRQKNEHNLFQIKFFEDPQNFQGPLYQKHKKGHAYTITY